MWLVRDKCIKITTKSVTIKNDINSIIQIGLCKTVFPMISLSWVSEGLRPSSSSIPSARASKILFVRTAWGTLAHDRQANLLWKAHFFCIAENLCLGCPRPLPRPLPLTQPRPRPWAGRPAASWPKGAGAWNCCRLFSITVSKFFTLFSALVLDGSKNRLANKRFRIYRENLHSD